ncbi:DMT family transporter [Novosphingobium sp. CECT 9465]|uniref:DMT family transporter n=1 Tax=Novosphingobium sp. CECT 9465 TaxID=2829794 RepID=UPI001E3FA8A4|nr:DMT family transporter [Novosphingobium sp. CECT 9465]CAH0495188.1 Pseudopaline exporter CntI [Novosphingobium sp. CECT 9465]
MNHNRTPFMPIVAALLGLGLFSIMDGVMKAASILAGAYAAMFWRGLAGSAMMLPLWLRRGNGWPPRATMRVHVLRGIVAVSMATLFFYGIVRTPLAEGIALSFIAPLIALYLAGIMLGEKIQSAAVGGSVLALLGVAVIGWGKFDGPSDPEAVKGLIAILVSAILYAWNLVLQRQQAQIAGPEEVAFFQSLVGFLFLGVGAWWLAPWPSATAWGLIVISAALSTGSLMLLSWAYSRAEAQVLVPLEYTAFIWAAIVGWIAFAEPVTLPTLGGVVLIVAGCLYATWRNPDPPRPEMPN